MSSRIELDNARRADDRRIELYMAENGVDLDADQARNVARWVLEAVRINPLLSAAVARELCAVGDML